jgi:hypothetical protein
MTERIRRSRIPELLALGSVLAALGLLAWPQGGPSGTSPKAASSPESSLASTSVPSDPGASRPETPSGNAALPPGSTPTTLVVLKVQPEGIALVAAAEKAVRFVPEPTDPGGARWRLLDRAGRFLAEGPLELPRLCACPRGRDHARGCTVTPHEAVVRLKLPRIQPQETLKLLDAERELASLDLEARS